MAAPPLTFGPFRGMIPKSDLRLLPPGGAEVASNCKLWSGALVPMRGQTTVSTPAKSGAIQSIYRMDDRAGGSSFWLHWPFDVDAVRGVAADTAQRLYFTGEYEPRVTNFEMAALGTDTVDGSDIYPAGFARGSSQYPLAFYALGAPVPITMPEISVSGGVAADVERGYYYTFVTGWGEESGPSPVKRLTGKPDGTWNLSLMEGTPANSGSIISAAHAGSTATFYTDTPNYLKRGHRITLASVGGMTELNGTRTVESADNIRVTTASRARTSNVATLVLQSVTGLAVGDVIYVGGLGGSATYNGAKTIASINTATKAITYNTGGAEIDEGTTADVTGDVVMARATVDLASGSAYTSGGTWKREAPWNVGASLKRIYRTLMGSGETQYQLVDEVAAATTTYADTVTDANLGYVGTTEGYAVPDGEMTSLIYMTNGIMVGACGEKVCFAEPYKPYAWPIAYEKPVRYPVKGMGAISGLLVVATSGVPVTFYGVHPSAMTEDRGEISYPCTSKRSLQSAGWGVVYSSDVGLIMVTSRGIQIATEAFASRDEWRSLVDEGRIESSMMFDNRYYGFWVDDSGIGHAIVFSPADGPSAVTTGNTEVTAAWKDPETGLAYVVTAAGAIAQWDAPSAARLGCEWKSGEIVIPTPANYGAARVEADFAADPADAAAAAAENATRLASNVALIATMPGAGFTQDVLWGSMGSRAMGYAYAPPGLAMAKTRLLDMLETISPEAVIFSLFTNDASGAMVLRHSETLTESKSFRLPGGYKSDVVAVGISANVTVRPSVKMAGAMRDLRRA